MKKLTLRNFVRGLIVVVCAPIWVPVLIALLFIGALCELGQAVDTFFTD